jgi:hypothetical protein
MFRPFAPFDVFRVPNLSDQAIPSPALALPLSGSLLPSTGTGTLTHTRATSAWMWRDSDGRMWRDYAAGRVLIECPAGELRFEGARRDDAGVYHDTLLDGTPIPANEISAMVEPQATNLLLNSDRFLTTSWQKYGTCSVLYENDAWTVSGLGSTDVNSLAQLNIPCQGMRTLLLAIYVKAADLSDVGKTIKLHMRRNAGTYTSSETSVVLTSEFQIASVSFVGLSDTSGARAFLMAGTASKCAVKFLTCSDVTGLAYQVPTTYIPTTTSTVTRNADALALTNYTLPNTLGTLYFEANAVDWAQVGGQLFGDGTEYLLAPITTQSGIRAFDGTNTANGPTGTPSGMMRFAVRWNATTGKMRLAANGVLGDEVTYDGDWNLGSQILASGFAGLVRNFRTYSTAMTDAQMKMVTK